VFRAAISGRAVSRLFDIVRWDYRERFGDGPQFDARSSVLILQARVAPISCFRPAWSCYGRQSGPRRWAPVALISCCHPGAYGKAAGTGCARPPVFLLLFTGKSRGTEWVGPRARSLIAAGRLAMLAAMQGDTGVQ